jgi:hypothetical protein
MLELNQKVMRRGNPPSRLIDGEALVVSTENGAASVLNLAAFEIWKWLESERTVAELLDFLCGQYDVSRQKAADDLTIFLEQLTDLGLIELN